MTLKERILRFSYDLASSKKYGEIKKRIWRLLNDPTYEYKKYFDFFMIFLVLSTIMILILEIKDKLPLWVYLYEGIAVIIFIIEWFGRLWVASDAHLDIIQTQEYAEYDQVNLTLWQLLKPALAKKVKFIISPMSIIDLLAILPSYRALRFLRFLLLFRLFKVFRYTENINDLLRVFVEKRFEFFSLIIIFAFLVFFASTVIYIFEGTGANPHIHGFYDAVYWAVVTITTVGYGDISPVTPEGRFVTIFLIISGITSISFMTSIITTAMAEKLELMKSNRTYHEIAKLKHFIVICGYGKMGKVLADELRLSDETIVILDATEEEVKEAQKDNFIALQADASDIDVLKALKMPGRVDYFVALTNDDANNLSIILSVKTIDPKIVIFARAVEKSARKKLLRAGAKEVIFPYEAAAIAAYEHLGQPVAFSAIDTILHEYVEPVIEEVEISHEMPVEGQTLKQIGVKKYRLKLLGVVRKHEKNKFYFHPQKDSFVVIAEDILILIGSREDINAFKIHLHEKLK
jgi:voltage-gated potassium channel